MMMKELTVAAKVLGMVFNHWREHVCLIKKFLVKSLSGMESNVEKRQSLRQNISRLAINLV